MRFISKAISFITRKKIMNHTINPEGVYIVTCHDKDGNLKWKDTLQNGVTDAGINLLLNIMFYSTSKISTWYLGLIDNASYSALDAGDTMALHSGWIENSNYGEATRPTWVTGTAAAKSITNPAPSQFTMNASVTIKGFFCVSNNTKGGSSGNLWSTALFSGGDQAVVNGDILNVTYSVTGA